MNDPAVLELVRLLRLANSYRDPTPGRDTVTGLGHALQTATLAEQADATSNMVVAALCHDIAKPFAVDNHGPAIAEILRPAVGRNIAWVLCEHGDASDQMKAGTFDPADWPPDTAQFAAWDSAAFDPRATPRPLHHFIPLLYRA